MKYAVILERESDGGYVASVPLLSGGVAQGNTREEALANIREAIAVYIECRHPAGDSVREEMPDIEVSETDDMRSEYDFRAGVRGKYADR